MIKVLVVTNYETYDGPYFLLSDGSFSVSSW